MTNAGGPHVSLDEMVYTFGALLAVAAYGYALIGAWSDHKRARRTGAGNGTRRIVTSSVTILLLFLFGVSVLMVARGVARLTEPRFARLDGGQLFIVWSDALKAYLLAAAGATYGIMRRRINHYPPPRYRSLSAFTEEDEGGQG